jgi:hypothetical protein
MPNPQQPELRRSERNEALSPDATDGRQEARRPMASNGDLGPVPESNRAGHHDDHDQDKPNLDAFAERLGIPPADEPDAFPEGPTPEAAVVDVAVDPLDERSGADVGTPPLLDGPRSPLEPASRASTATRGRPGRDSGTATWGGLVRAGTTVTLGPWIVIGRLAEQARDAIDRRVT